MHEAINELKALRMRGIASTWADITETDWPINIIFAVYPPAP